VPWPGAITVTHSSGTHSVNSVLSQEAFVLSGGTLVVSNSIQVNNGLTLSGGTLRRASVLQGTNGVCVVCTGNGGTLDGVTVSGVLDVGNQNSGAAVTVTNGLTLTNGTVLVGNPTNGPDGSVAFSGSHGGLLYIQIWRAIRDR
jgi:hypothetical protein